MSGTELVYNLFAECSPGGASHAGLCIVNPEKEAGRVIGAIAIALVVKGALTIVTFGVKLPAGIFIPSLGGMFRLTSPVVLPHFRCFLRVWWTFALICRVCVCGSGGMCGPYHGHTCAVDAAHLPT